MCATCGRKPKSCPGGSCPSGILADPYLVAAPPWVRHTLKSLLGMVRADEDFAALRQGVQAQYIEKSAHDAEVRRLKEEIRMLRSRPSLQVVDGARHAQSPEPTPVPSPPAAPVAAPRPCRCRGIMGTTCPICQGTRVVP